MRFCKAFTLIELIVVIAIISIMMGSALAFYNDFSAVKSLESESKRLGDVLSLARKNAMAGYEHIACTDFSGYQMTINSNTYTMEQCCGSACGTTVQTYNISSSAGVSVTAGTGSVKFKQLSEGTNLSSNLTIRMKSSTNSKCIDVNVFKNGVIEVGSQPYTGGGC